MAAKPQEVGPSLPTIPIDDEAAPPGGTAKFYRFSKKADLTLLSKACGFCPKERERNRVLLIVSIYLNCYYLPATMNGRAC